MSVFCKGCGGVIYDIHECNVWCRDKEHCDVAFLAIEYKKELKGHKEPEKFLSEIINSYKCCIMQEIVVMGYKFIAEGPSIQEAFPEHCEILGEDIYNRVALRLIWRFRDHDMDNSDTFDIDIK